MYIVPIAWLYVALMMAVAEATNANGTLLGAIITFLLYGVLPVALVVYLMGTSSRKRARQAREAAANRSVQEADNNLAQDSSAPSDAPDAGGHAPATAEHGVVAPVREKP